MSSSESSIGRKLLPNLVAAVAAIALAFGAYGSILELGFLGWDAYPMVLASRVTNAADFFGNFTEELMDGRYPHGHFYRPVTNLSFALDHAIAGVDARTFHRTDLLVFAVNCALVFALSRKLFGSVGLLAGGLAGLVFLLHPSQIEVFPVSARRADMLCMTFLFACLLAQPLTKSRASRTRLALGAVLAVCSAASKETGVIVAPIVFGLHFFACAGGFVGRARHAFLRTLPIAGAIAAHIALRTFMLGGLGGHPQSSLTNVGGALTSFGHYAGLALQPQPMFESGGARLAWSVVLGAALMLGAALCWIRAKQPANTEAKSLDERAALLFLVWWCFCLLVISSVSGDVSEIRVWYAMPFLAPYAILLDFLLRKSRSALSDKRFVGAGLLATAPLLLLASHVRFTHAVWGYTEWEEVDSIGEAYRETLLSTLRQTPPGEVGLVPGFNPKLRKEDGGPGIEIAAIHTDYTLQAFVELVEPDRPVVVRAYRGGRPPEPPGGDVVHLLLVSKIR